MPTSAIRRTIHAVALAAATMLVASGCTLWTFGQNSVGQLGDGTTSDSNVPVNIGTTGDWALGAESKGDFSCALEEDRTLWCWGLGSDGQLGNGATDPSTVPVQAGTASNWARVATGERTACGIRQDGTLWCWGANTFGQLGQGTSGAGVSTPTQVGTDTDWAIVAGGGIHFCAVKTTGTLWCWGLGSRGQLGNGFSSGFVTSPGQVGTDTDWSTVAGGSLHTCAIKDSGTLWCWGDNSTGTLGDGTTTERQVPTQVGTATDWTSVSGGTFSTCGIRGTARTAWCWGDGDKGALGDGTGTDRLTPTQVTGGGGWGSLSTGREHSCGVRQGALYCWGTNIWGQLGDGTFTQRLAPTQIGTDTDWVLAYAGFNQTTALKN